VKLEFRESASIDPAHRPVPGTIDGSYRREAGLALNKTAKSC